MSRKKTIQLNYPAAKSAIDKNFRSNVVFCEAMGFQNRNSWVSDLKRNKNLPSPEEAARMCILLNTTPEEILLREGSTEAETARCQQDIEMVRQLVEEARGAEKAPDPKIEGLMQDEELKEAIEILKQMDKETLRAFVKIAKATIDK